MSEKLSLYMTEEEFTYSETAVRHGIDNSMNHEQKQRAISFCTKFYDKLRDHLCTEHGQYCHTNSGHRSEALNKALPNSSKTSQHMLQNAVDMVPNNGYNLAENMYLAATSGLPFDQLMIEGVSLTKPMGSWIHASYNTNLSPELQRRQIKIVTFNFDKDGDGIKDPDYKSVTLEELTTWIRDNGFDKTLEIPTE